MPPERERGEKEEKGDGGKGALGKRKMGGEARGRDRGHGVK